MVRVVVVLALLVGNLYSAGWDTPPAGWNDVKFGLVNDDAEYCNSRLKEAIVDRGIKVDYRYIYINGGVDTNANRISWSFSQNRNYTLQSKSKVGAEAAYVVYMLQEEGGAAALKEIGSNSSKMKQFFESLRVVAQYANGKKSTWVIEPDTWGYVLQNNQSDTGSSFLQNVAHLNDLGYDHLKGFDNKISNLPQAIIAHIKHYAPDAYAGILMSFWSIDANNLVAKEYQTSGAVGFADWSMKACELSAEMNLAFAKKLLPRSDFSKGDFIGVEKNGYDAGWWKVNGDKGDYYYWDDDQMKKWLRWCEILGKGVELPLLGWQISVGHMGLPNKGSANSTNEVGNGQYEDTFFPYFFAHPQDFTGIGFIGFLVGKGLADGTDYTNSTSEPTKGDQGWFLDQLKSFDTKRPWIPSGGATYSITASAGQNGSVTPDGAVSLKAGYKGAVSIKASSGYYVDSVLIDGVNHGPVVSIQFPGISENHSVSAAFTKIPGQTGGTADAWVAKVYPTTTVVLYQGELWTNGWYANASDVPGVASVWKKAGGDTGPVKDTLITVEVEYRSSVSGPDTLIKVTTTKIKNGTTTSKTETTLSNGSVGIVKESKQSNSSQIEILGNGKSVTIHEPGTYRLVVRNIQGRVLQARSLEITSAGSVETGIGSIASGMVIISVEGARVAASKLVVMK